MTKVFKVVVVASREVIVQAIVILATMATASGVNFVIMRVRAVAEAMPTVIANSS